MYCAIINGNGNFYRLLRDRRNAFAMTETELKDIAALAITGLSKRPKWG